MLEILIKENNVLLIKSPIVICGDIHGQFDDLLKLFQISGGIDIVDSTLIFKGQKYLFMGDYVDRGYYSLNTFLLLCCLKLQNPDKIFLLRGNHECRRVSYTYGFYNEIMLKYGHSSLWIMCNDVFDLLPMAALIDNDIFCVHGGLSPDIPLIECISMYNRKVEVPETGPFADLCWSDPDEVKRFKSNGRGAGYLFGKPQVVKFNRLNRLRAICRSHQLAMKGYEKYFGNITSEPDVQLITVWSAPNYAYRSGNVASIMKLRFEDEEEPYSLHIFEQDENYVRPTPEETPVVSFYFA
ncbi:Ser/Thr protein phosphatase [Histomonas meleagridis]|nr:Ser/Thr protein phosphatase [Histomonas meleagridis]